MYTHKKALRDRQKSAYDAHAKALPSLSVGDTVRIEPTSVKKGQAWESGTVTQQVGERSFNVLTQANQLKNRNRAQLRKTSSAPATPEQPTENQPITAAHETPSVHEQHSTLEQDQPADKQPPHEAVITRKSTRPRAPRHVYQHLP